MSDHRGASQAERVGRRQGPLTCADPTLELCALTWVFTDDHVAQVCSDGGWLLQPQLCIDGGAEGGRWRRTSRSQTAPM